MKTMLWAALVLGLCGPARAEDAKADPVGAWKCIYDIGQKRESTLVIKGDRDTLTGTMTYQDKQVAKLRDLKFRDGELTFSAERQLATNKVTVEYSLKVQGDRLKGKGAVDVGGEKREFNIEGKRQK